jgi:hypothetical protein
MPVDDRLRLPYALLRPDTVLAAVEALRSATDRAAVEGLVELVYAARPAKEAVAAVAALDGCDRPIVLDALAAALDGPHASVRLAAVQSLHRRRAPRVAAALGRLLARDVA